MEDTEEVRDEQDQEGEVGAEQGMLKADVELQTGDGVSHPIHMFSVEPIDDKGLVLPSERTR